MASEWARKRAEELSACREPWAIEQFAAALDEARAEAEKRGAERERWECAKIACVPGHAMATAIYAAIAARGPMRGPEEE